MTNEENDTFPALCEVRVTFAMPPAELLWLSQQGLVDTTKLPGLYEVRLKMSEEIMQNAPVFAAMVVLFSDAARAMVPKGFGDRYAVTAQVAYK